MENLKFENKRINEIRDLVSLNKKLSKELDKITILNSVDLRDSGENNNLDNFQIFTPRFIVDGMIEAVGKDHICNNEYNILEPTSGDGAFTCRILELRLRNNFEKNKDNYLIDSLKSLSTIYSIEMDETLIKRQRNNIITTFYNVSKELGFKLDEDYFYLVKLMTQLNFIWGMFDTDSEIGILCQILLKMPDAEKGQMNYQEFPVWSISDNQISLHYEDAEVAEQQL